MIHTDGNPLDLSLNRHVLSPSVDVSSARPTRARGRHRSEDCDPPCDNTVRRGITRWLHSYPSRPAEPAAMADRPSTSCHAAGRLAGCVRTRPATTGAKGSIASTASASAWPDLAQSRCWSGRITRLQFDLGQEVRRLALRPNRLFERPGCDCWSLRGIFGGEVFSMSGRTHRWPLGTAADRRIVHQLVNCPAHPRRQPNVGGERRTVSR